MNVEARLALLRRIGEVAALAGLSGEIDDEGQHFVMTFALEEGRSQTVYVRPTMVSSNGDQMISVMSPCLVVKKGLLSGLSKQQALDLLRRNESMPFARYGMIETDSESMIVASVDHLLETLDADELEHSAWCVAQAADSYEREFGGGDRF